MNKDSIIKEVKVTYQLRQGSFIDKDGKRVDYEYVYCPDTEEKIKLSTLAKKYIGLSTNK